MTPRETDVLLPDGRVLHAYDTGPADAAVTVYWHHGTPSVGAPPEPLFAAATELGIRWLAHDRPGYGPSTRLPDRSVAAVAQDAAAVADALGVGRFATMGASGGGPPALACAALLGDRVTAVAAIASLAPFDVDGLDWFADMYPGGVAELRAATDGPAALERHLTTEGFDPAMFVDADLALLAGEWAWLGRIAGQAIEGGWAGTIDDDLAFVRPWGFDPARITAPVLVQHGERDRCVPIAHGRRLATLCPTAEFLPYSADGHVSVLRNGATTLEWLAGR